MGCVESLAEEAGWAKLAFALSVWVGWAEIETLFVATGGSWMSLKAVANPFKALCFLNF